MIAAAFLAIVINAVISMMTLLFKSLRNQSSEDRADLRTQGHSPGGSPAPIISSQKPGFPALLLCVNTVWAPCKASPFRWRLEAVLCHLL